MKSTENIAAPPTVSAELLRQYRDLVVPHRSTRYHYRRFGGWLAAKWPNGDWQVLNDYAVRRHLDETSYGVSARWSLDGLVSHAVIDLDSSLKHARYRHLRMNPNHVACADEEMRFALGEVLDALGHPPHVVFRSSTSRGLHVYLFLDDLYPAIEVRNLLVELLTAADLAPRGGIVDQVFPANQALRLPLGAGSCILDDTEYVAFLTGQTPPQRWWYDPLARRLEEGPEVDHTLRPAAARETPVPPPALLLESYEYLGLREAPPPGVVRLSRDIPASIALLEHLASTRRVSLSTLQSTLRRVEEDWAKRQPWLQRGVLDKEERKNESGERGAGERGDVHVDSAAPASKGERFTQSRALLSGFYREGLSRGEALRRYEDWLWLSAKSGTSKDLVGAAESTIRSHVHDGGGFWTWLEKNAATTVQRGSRLVALSAVVHVPPRSISSSSSSFSSTPRSWSRAAALAAVTAADEVLLASIPCDWTKGKVRVLVGALRQAGQAPGGSTEVTIGAQVLDRVVGGRPPPKTAKRIDADGELLSARQTVLREAARAGFIERVDRGLKGKRASLYRVNLPSRPFSPAFGPEAPATSPRCEGDDAS